MDLLWTIIFITAALAFFLLGYILMARLDKYLSENRKVIEKEWEVNEPGAVMLTDTLSEDEIFEEIRKFKNKHAKVRIILYDECNNSFVHAEKSCIK